MGIGNLSTGRDSDQQKLQEIQVGVVDARSTRGVKEEGVRMGLRLFTSGLLVVGLLSWVGCDFSGADSTDNIVGPPPPPPGECLEVPFLTGNDGLAETICAGDVVVLEGFNFSADLSRNRVTFRGNNNSRIPGLPVRVVFPTDGDCQNGLESELEIQVPSGIVSGNIEVVVNGVPAGGFGYSACAQIYGFSLSADGMDEFITHTGILGFQQNSFVQLWGLNFNSIAEIEARTGGNTAVIPRSAIQQSPAGTNTTGFANIGFNLDGGPADTLTIDDGRVDVEFALRGGDNNRLSNVIQIPVVRPDLINSFLGAVVNSVYVPSGVAGGPVRIRYSMYDTSVDASWNMLVQWRVAPDAGSDPGPWIPAAPDLNDPLHDGVDGILPGLLVHQPASGLLRAGAERIFTWDPLLDSNFPPSNDTGLSTFRQVWPIEFRISPRLENGERPDFRQHAFVTPIVLFEDLQDPPGTEPGGQTDGIFLKTSTPWKGPTPP